MYSFSSRNCGIVRSIIFWRDSDTSDPANMFLPSSNSARITPFEKISDRWSVILSTISYSIYLLFRTGLPQMQFQTAKPLCQARPMPKSKTLCDAGVFRTFPAG